MTDPEAAALYRLMAWLSPSYPVGGYSYSHGLEWAVEEGLVRTASDLEDFVAAALAFGSGWGDAVLLAAAWRAAAAGDDAGLAAVAELGAALRGAAELALESTQQGQAFLKATLAAWPAPGLAARIAALNAPPVLPVAVGCVAAVHGVPLGPALAAYLPSFAASLVSAGVRLVPLGQSAGQAVIAALEGRVLALTRRAAAAKLEDIAFASPVIDWCAMRHETQTTRLYRS